MNIKHIFAGMFVVALLLGSSQTANSQIIYRLPVKSSKENDKAAESKRAKARKAKAKKANSEKANSKKDSAKSKSKPDQANSSQDDKKTQAEKQIPLVAGEVITAEGTLVVANADGRAMGPAVDVTKPNMLGERFLRGKPVRLFDGVSLSGWSRPDGSPSKNWVVEDGAIYRKSRGGSLFHSDWYKDFQLTFEWKLLEGGNSGVKYRVKQYGNKTLGCEYQLQDDKGKDYHVHATGALYALYAPTTNKVAPKLGEWNKSTIVVAGYRAQHWLNGELVVDLTFGDSDWYRRVENSKFKEYENFGLNRSGRIFFQDHGNPVWFRNIVLVPIDSTQENPLLGSSDSGNEPVTVTSSLTPVIPTPDQSSATTPAQSPSAKPIAVPSAPFDQTDTSEVAPGFEANERDR